MLIQEICIKNFRSIGDITIKSSNFNIFVGQNNHGKSNIFEALDYFFNGVPKGQSKDIKNKNTEGDVEVSITFKDVEKGIELMKNENHKKDLQKDLNAEKSNIITITRKNEEKRELFVNQIQKKLGAENTWNDLLPKFEYIDARKHADSLEGYKKTNEIGKLLNDIIASISEENQDYKNFITAFDKYFNGDFANKKLEIEEGISKNVQEQFPDCTKVEFKINTPAFDDLLKKLEVNIDDGVETSYKDKGDGMQRALMLAIIRYYSNYLREKETKGKNIIFCIDEAELHLHPLAQRSLKEALHQISENGDQVFINTHSSVLIAEDSYNQKIFKVEKVNKITNTTEIQEKQSIIYDLLGGLPTDLLFPNNFLIVEGYSEEIFINKIIERFYSNEKKIQVINAKGDGRLNSERVTIQRIYENLSNNNVYKDKLILLMDTPNDENIKITLKEKLGDRLFILPTKGIETYYPKSFQEKHKNIISKKKEVALLVANEIEKEVFEKEMPNMYQALEKCFETAY